jgi:uncharacterized protein (TIGR02118 family)
VIKFIGAAIRHPTNRSLADFQRYWAESHGPLYANTRALRRYVQHITLTEAYGGEGGPNLDGVSMFWFDDLDALRNPSTDPRDVALREAVGADDRQLFDRSTGWPADHRRASVVATERIVLDGETRPSMVKRLAIASRHPGLSYEEFFDHWFNVHGALAAKVPGLRRYVQNHAIVEAIPVLRGLGAVTHDGWSELWFDDLDSLRQAMATPEWQALREDGVRLFARASGVGIARERVQKWGDFKRKDGGAATMSEAEIRARLEQQGFRRLAADPEAPARIKAAAQAEALAIWSDEHIVTIDSSRIDARPER